MSYEHKSLFSDCIKMEKFTRRKSKQIHKPFDIVKTQVKISRTIFTGLVFCESAHISVFTSVITQQGSFTFLSLCNTKVIVIPGFFLCSCTYFKIIST